MTFVDWSDAEDMFGLLVDYVTDELADAQDRGRRRFLSGLLGALAQLQERLPAMPPREQAAALRDLNGSVEEEFAHDPVTQHLEDCAAELERLGDGSG